MHLVSDVNVPKTWQKFIFKTDNYRNASKVPGGEGSNNVVSTYAQSYFFIIEIKYV